MAAGLQCPGRKAHVWVSSLRLRCGLVLPQDCFVILMTPCLQALSPRALSPGSHAVVLREGWRLCWGPMGGSALGGLPTTVGLLGIAHLAWMGLSCALRGYRA